MPGEGTVVTAEAVTHAALVAVAYRWTLARCGFALREYRTFTPTGETPDVLGFRSDCSVLVEVKVSRADFLADRKKPFRQGALGMGNFRYFLCPEGLVEPNELPERWGLLVATSRGVRVARGLKHPGRSSGGERPDAWWHDANLAAERAVLYSVVRRVHLRDQLEGVYTEVASGQSGSAP